MERGRAEIKGGAGLERGSEEKGPAPPDDTYVNVPQCNNSDFIEEHKLNRHR